VFGIIVTMTEMNDIEMQMTNAQTIEDQQHTINKTRRWTPVVIFTIGFALVIVMLGLSMWIGISGLGNNLSEREGGLADPGTNLGSQNDPNLAAGEAVPESHDEKNPKGENWTPFSNSRNKRFIIGEPDWDPKIQWKLNKERYDRIRDNRDHWNGKGPAYWNCLRCGYWWKLD